MNHVHFIGIGGVGMSGLAQVLLSRGVRVSGSDPNSNAATERLAQQGATIYPAQVAENIAREKPDLVVVTAAIHEGNPELEAAKAAGIPNASRAEFLGRLMAEFKGPRIAIAGTHGKTTTTAMVAEVLIAGGLDPTVLVGGEYAPIGGNVRVGKSEVFLTEACEAYDSFLALHPDITVITNVEADHLDHYGTEEKVFEGFAKFAAQTSEKGVVIWCADDSGARSVFRDHEDSPLGYGIDARDDCSIMATEIETRSGGVSFHILDWSETKDRKGFEWVDSGVVQLRVPGNHNVQNALAAVAVGQSCRVPFEAIKCGLESFVGTERRFERVGEIGGVTVIDDYAHHPTEIRATLAAARSAFPDRRIVAVFQPHLYSRTRDFLNEFAEALSTADVTLLTDIYAAREEPIPEVRVSDIVERIAAIAPKASVLYVPAKRELVGALEWVTHAGDVVITMGAGDIREVADSFNAERKGAAA